MIVSGPVKMGPNRRKYKDGLKDLFVKYNLVIEIGGRMALFR